MGAPNLGEKNGESFDQLVKYLNSTFLIWLAGCRLLLPPLKSGSLWPILLARCCLDVGLASGFLSGSPPSSWLFVPGSSIH